VNNKKNIQQGSGINQGLGQKCNWKWKMCNA